MKPNKKTFFNILKNFINKLIKEANKNQIIISKKKLTILNTNYKCYHYVHNLALQNSTFKTIAIKYSRYDV